MSDSSETVEAPNVEAFITRSLALRLLASGTALALYHALVKIECVFRRLDEERIIVEYRGEEESIRRTRVLGVILSPVAGTEVDTGDEGTLWLQGGGRLPAVLRGISFGSDDDTPRLDLKIHGVPWSVDLRFVDRVSFASDRIRFLSDLEPNRVREVPFFDNVFPYRKDLSVGGGPLLLRGTTYRKGLGVHSRSILQYELGESFTSFVARVGIDDALGRRGKATVRVIGNGRKLYEGKVVGDGEPLEVVVSILGIKTLTLETDYGDDGTDLGDHVDWAEARLVKPSRNKTADANDTESEKKKP